MPLTSVSKEQVPSYLKRTEKYRNRQTLTVACVVMYDSALIPTHRPVCDFFFQIYNDLKKSGYSIWIDIEQMNKYMNLLEGMASAVEGASVVLICYSEKYKNSQNCRTGNSSFVVLNNLTLLLTYW